MFFMRILGKVSALGNKKEISEIFTKCLFRLLNSGKKEIYVNRFIQA